MAGIFLPLMLDIIGQGLTGMHHQQVPHQNTFQPTSSDASADSTNIHTVGPAANHGGINLNLHFHQENRSHNTTTHGITEEHRDYVRTLLERNFKLEHTLEQIASNYSVRRKRSSRRVSDYWNRQAKNESTTRRPLGEEKPVKVCRRSICIMKICTWRTTYSKTCLAYKPYKSAPTTTTPRPFKANFVTTTPKPEVFDEISFLQGFLKSYCLRQNPFQRNVTFSNPDMSNDNNKNGRNSTIRTRSNIHSGNWS